MRLNAIELPGCWSADVLGNRLGLCVGRAGDSEAQLPMLARRLREISAAPDGVAFCELGLADARFAFVNPDGSGERVCGNAALAIAALLIPPDGRLALDTRLGDGRAIALSRTGSSVELTMWPAQGCVGARITTPFGHGRHVDVGTPHVVVPVSDPRVFDLHKGLRAVSETGMNVSLCSAGGADIVARTFERGLAHETGACGTGALAVGLAAYRGEPVDCLVRYPGGVYRFRSAESRGLQVAGIQIRADAVGLSWVARA